MKGNKGFTLIELIATIALLSIIAVISFVSISTVLEDSKSKNCDSLVNNINSATKEYISDNRYNFSSTSTVTIYATDLVDGKYLSGTIVDPFSGNNLDSDKISIDVELNDDYSAKEITIYSGEDVIDCNNKYTFEYAGGLKSGNNDDSETGEPSGSTSSSSGSSSSSLNGSGTNKSITVVDKSSGSCAQAIEYFYSDGQYRYYFNCIKSSYMYVVVDGTEYQLVDALENGIVTMAEIESNGYSFEKESLNFETS